MKRIKFAKAFSLGIVLLQISYSTVFAGFLYLPFNSFYAPTSYVGSYPGHTGTDYRGNGYGTPVYAAYGGTVVALKETENDGCDITYTQQLKYGNYVKIDHQVGSIKYRTEYWHLKQNGVVVNVGQKVKTGDLISYISNSGLTVGADCAKRPDLPNGAYYHLHFEVKKWGGNKWVVLNPYSSGSGWLWANNPPLPSTQAPPPPCSYTVGQDSSRKNLFEQAYNRNGGRNSLGCPSGPTYWWKSGINWVVRQDFVGSAIIQHEGVNDNYAYVVKGTIWNYYKSHVTLGAPISDQFENPYGYFQSDFSKGFIFVNSVGSAIPVVYGDWYWVTQGADITLNASFADASGGGVRLILDGLGGSGGWLSGATVAKEIDDISINPETVLLWEQYDKKHSLHFALTILDKKGDIHSLTYSANASNVWNNQGYVSIREPDAQGNYPAVYDEWEVFARNIYDDYLTEWGVEPVLISRLRVSHYLHDTWVGDKGGTVQNIVFDYDPPETEIEVIPDFPDGGEGWYLSPPLIALTATDDASGIAGIEYDLGNGWQIYAGPFLIEQEGNVTVQYRAIDFAGKVEQTQSNSFKIDTTKPQTNIYFIGNYFQDFDGNVFISSQTEVELLATDEISGVAETIYYNSHSGQNGEEESYSVPFRLTGEDGEHTVLYQSVDVAGNDEEPNLQEVYLDSTPPVSSDDSDGDWHNEDVAVVITAQDPNSPDLTPGSGVREMKYHGSQEGDGLGGLVDLLFMDEGTHEIFYYSVDNVQNTEEEKNAHPVKIDKTPPQINGTLTSDPNENGWYSHNVTVHFEAADQEYLSGLKSVTPALVISTEGFNQETFGVAEDQAGNFSEVTLTGINIDMTAPQSYLSMLEPYYNKLPVEIGYEYTDNLSGVERVRLYKRSSSEQGWSFHYSLSNLESPFHVWSLEEGYWEFASAALDFAGNVEDRTWLADTVTIYDSTAPLTNLGITGAEGLNGWYVSAVDTTLFASDVLSGVSQTFYQILTDPESLSLNYSEPVHFLDGFHEIEFWSFDLAGNEEARQLFSFKVDTLPPLTPSSSIAGGDFLIGNPVITDLTSPEESALIYYSFDGEDFFPYQDSLQLEDSVAIFSYAVDEAGNESDISSWFFNFHEPFINSPENSFSGSSGALNLDNNSSLVVLANESDSNVGDQGEVQGVESPQDTQPLSRSYGYQLAVLFLILMVFGIWRKISIHR
ncbi:MAG: peptidoglycan DD-metalloendopeptidase family protein [Patescibacteria group bacterium]